MTIVAGVLLFVIAVVLLLYVRASWTGENPNDVVSQAIGSSAGGMVARSILPGALSLSFLGAFAVVDGTHPGRAVAGTLALLALCSVFLVPVVALTGRPRRFVAPRYRGAAALSGNAHRRGPQRPTAFQSSPVGTSLGAFARDPARHLERAFADAGFAIERATVERHEVVVARRADFRLRWAACRLHTFVFLVALETITAREAEQLTVSTQQYAIDHKQGLPRGLGTGTLNLPVFLCANSDDATKRWFETEPTPGFAALRYPVLVDREAQSLSHYRHAWSGGNIFRSYVIGLITNTIEPAIRAA